MSTEIRINDELVPTYEQLKTKAAELVKEASIVYAAYNATVREPDGDFADFQTIHELQALCQEYHDQPEHVSLKADRDAQQKRADALAVENEAMREAIAFATAPDMWIEQHDGMLDYRYSEWYVDVLNAAVETPATSAALAAIEARGVEKLAAYLWKRGNEIVSEGGKKLEVIQVRVAAKMAEMFANELREAK
ncbi:Uncharacterised protein [Serratia grimesii]|uniref:hypothetical protein n=1 Tax=Serratia grimesii TaxID=82995 RepID=UPI002178083A|nr:hypothetical protein [Serratia grimesii]CAI1833825.1 Uncharacterised protein [Serratia grimesii]